MERIPRCAEVRRAQRGLDCSWPAYATDGLRRPSLHSWPAAVPEKIAGQAEEHQGNRNQ